jgi:ABC-2 type transport system ATP-binding protein
MSLTRAPLTSVPMTDSPVVVLRDARRSFHDLVAVDDLSFSLDAGAVTVLVGPNGAGKTTVVRMITGAMAADSGSVSVFGLDPFSKDGETVRARTGIVPAKPALYDRLSGHRNLAYAAQLYGVPDDVAPERIQEAATRFGIEDALGQRVGAYSTGMKARLALARSILHDPDLLLFDEPTAGLDPESGRAVLGLIDKMAADGKTVLMCTHLLIEAEGLADEIIVMERGRALVAGSPAALTEQYWEHTTVLLDATERTELDRIAVLEYVRSYQRNGAAIVELESLSQVADLVDDLVRSGVRLVRVEPRSPSLEQLYFAIRSKVE